MGLKENMKLSDLEKKVLFTIADNHADGRIIKAQAAQAKVDQRDYTGVGFRTYFKVKSVRRHLNKAIWKTRDMPKAYGKHPDLSAGASFVLLLADGFISCLEGLTDGEDWPKNEAKFKIQTSSNS